jgi:transketolase
MAERSAADMSGFIGLAGRDAFGKMLAEMGEENKNIVALSADCENTTKLSVFAKKFPERTFNFGIAEANMVSAAAGMAVAGKIPVAGGFGFLMALRTTEQIRTDICYPRLNVKIVSSASGLAMGTGGTTHHCTEDFAIMRSFANIVIVSPASPIETAKATRAILEYEGPVYFRLERDAGFGGVEEIYTREDIPFKLGKAITLEEGKDLTMIFTGGALGKMAVEAAKELKKQGVSVRLINMHTVKPLDEEVIKKAAEETKRIVTVEEHNVVGGMGEGVASVVAEAGIPARVKKVGICDEFCCIGPTAEVMRIHGLTAENIISTAKSLL